MVMLVLVGGSGFFFFKAYTAYSANNQQHQMLTGKLRKLENYEIYPDTQNVEAMEVAIDAYETEVNKLHEQLKAFQTPLKQIPARQFPQDLKRTVEEFRDYRVKNRVVTPEPFYLGFDKYEFNEPVPGATGILQYQLEATNHLVHLAIDNGADVIYSLTREETAVERGEEDPELTQRVVKYPVTFAFRTTHEGFREFLNKVSNGTDYFYLVRVLRIDNEKKEGPPKVVQRQEVWIGPDGEVITSDDLNEEGGIELDFGDLTRQDARVVMGNEKLKITAVIDICRFPDVGGEAAGDDQLTSTN